MTAYDKLLSKVKETTLLGSAGGILNWDMLTYMPPGATELRGEQLAAITQAVYRIQNGTEYTNLIKETHKQIELYDPIKTRNILLLKEQHDQTTALSEEPLNIIVWDTS